MSAKHPHIFSLAVVPDCFTKSCQVRAVAGQRCAAAVGIYAAETTSSQRSLLIDKRCAHDVVENKIHPFRHGAHRLKFSRRRFTFEGQA